VQDLPFPIGTISGPYHCSATALASNFMPANEASPSMHLNPNVWLPNQARIVATFSKQLMIVFFTSTVG